MLVGHHAKHVRQPVDTGVAPIDEGVLKNPDNLREIKEPGSEVNPFVRSRWPPHQQCPEPGPTLGAMDLGVAENGDRTGHKQAAQIAITLLADTATSVLGPAGVLLRHDPDPGREIPP
jgi:hypothetical protein